MLDFWQRMVGLLIGDLTLPAKDTVRAGKDGQIRTILDCIGWRFRSHLSWFSKAYDL